jgi:sulfide:quinone oxidoreductase
MRVVVLGAGFGGLEAASGISQALGSDADITLIDRSEGFVFGFSKLDLTFGHAELTDVFHRYSDIAKPGLRFVQSTVRAIDAERRVVMTDAGEFAADVLVVALGAELDPGATPGLDEVGEEFYSAAGALAARRRLETFQGGHIVLGVSSLPVKCAPAPGEAALLVHDFLVRRGIRDRSDVTLVSPVPTPVPPSPPASKVLVAAFAERGITWIPGCAVTALDAARRVVVLSDGRELPFDLYLGVPRHHAPTVVVDAGLTENGWIPVDPRTMLTRFANVYAIGDVTSVGTPKAGVFAEGQGRHVAESIIARHRGDALKRDYEATGYCYLRVGEGNVAEVHVTVVPGEATSSVLRGPSPELADSKKEYARSRVQRWFGES